MLITEKKKTKKAKPARVTQKVIVSPKEEISTQPKAEEHKVRYLKLQPFFRESRSKCLYKPPATIVPELRLCGDWLEKAGFLPSHYVSVTVKDKLLIIRLSKEQGSD